MKINKLTLKDSGFPQPLKHIPHPPKQLFMLGSSLEDIEGEAWVAIVGSRKVSPYGTHVTKKLAGELAKQGIGIISGLALGVDGLAHQASLEAGGRTIAVLPCGLDRIYPGTHRHLGLQILKQGGTLISEYPENTEPFQSNFLERNRLISGLSKGVIITEAAQRSGSLNTASHALEQGKTVMAVPGNITSLLSAGTNNLIRSGAVPITSAEDVLAALNITLAAKEAKEVIGRNEEEQIVIQLLRDGIADAGELLKRSQLDTAIFNQTLTMLEITGVIKPLGAGQWALS